MSAVQMLSPSKNTRGSSPAKQPFSEPKLEKINDLKCKKTRKKPNSALLNLSPFTKISIFCVFCEF